jgi:hypothetical protein
MGFAIFGRSLRIYRNFFISLTTCFRMLLGEVNAPDMFSVSRVYGNSINRKMNNDDLIVLGTFYFVSFIILVFIALLSIFLTM